MAALMPVDTCFVQFHGAYFKEERKSVTTIFNNYNDEVIRSYLYIRTQIKIKQTNKTTMTASTKYKRNKNNW